MDYEASVRPLELGLCTSTLRLGGSSWVIDSCPTVWPFELGLWTLTLSCGPLRSVDGLPHFGVVVEVRAMGFYISVWPLELVLWTPTIRCGP